MQKTLSLFTFYSGWEGLQKNLLKIIAQLSDEQLALPSAPHHWPIGIIAQHIIANRVWWFQVWMGEGNPELAPIAHWDPADEVEVPPLGTAELVTALEDTWQMIQEALLKWTPADLEQIFQPPAVMSEQEQAFFGELSRQWIIWHVIEHELLHTGELSLALGGYNLKSIYD